MPEEILRSAMGPLLTEAGYQERNGVYYRFRGSLTFAVRVERTGLLWGCTAYIIPMYLPDCLPYFTYGDRTAGLIMEKIPGSAGEEALAVWSGQVLLVLRRVILPLFERLAQPWALLEFLKQDPEQVQRFFPCSTADIFRLRIYTRLLVGQLQGLRADLERMWIPVAYEHFSAEDLPQRYLEERDWLLGLLNGSGADYTEYLSRVMQRNQRRFQLPQAPGRSG